MTAKKNLRPAKRASKTSGDDWRPMTAKERRAFLARTFAPSPTVLLAIDTRAAFEEAIRIALAGGDEPALREIGDLCRRIVANATGKPDVVPATGVRFGKGADRYRLLARVISDVQHEIWTLLRREPPAAPVCEGTPRGRCRHAHVKASRQCRHGARSSAGTVCARPKVDARICSREARRPHCFPMVVDDQTSAVVVAMNLVHNALAVHFDVNDAQFERACNAIARCSASETFAFVPVLRALGFSREKAKDARKEGITRVGAVVFGSPAWREARERGGQF